MSAPLTAILSAALTALALLLAGRPAPLPRRPVLPTPELPDPQSRYAELRLSMRPAAPDPVLQKLAAPLPRFTADQQPLDKTLATLADRAGVRLAINWPAIQAAGVEPHTPVSVDLRDLPARVVLSHVLDDHDLVRVDNVPDLVKLVYEPADGVVLVSTIEDIASRPVLRAYDVRDLIDPAKSLFADVPRPPGACGAEEIESVVRLIQEAIDPASWRDAGGTVSWISAINGRLIVNGTAQTHAELAELLTLLRLPTDQTSRPDPAALRLEAPVGHFAFHNRPLAEVLAALADRAGVNVAVNWRELKPYHVTPATPVTIDFRDLPARTVLRYLLLDVGGDPGDGNFRATGRYPCYVAYYVADGVVIVSTENDVERHTLTRAYDVTPFLEGLDARDRPEARDDLIRLIQETVEPLSFRDAPGYNNWMRSHNARLIFSNVAEVHDHFARLLKALRAKTATTVIP